MHRLFRSKGGYEGLVACVAWERQRITSQAQSEIRLTRTTEPVESNTEAMEDDNEVADVRTKLTNEAGVVHLETMTIDLEDDTDSDDKEPAIPPRIAPVVKKPVEEIGNYSSYCSLSIL